MTDTFHSRTGTVTQADHVIGILGGVNATARLLGHRNASTVQGWVERGFIPGKQQKPVLDAAREAGLPLTEKDFTVHLRDCSEPEADPEAKAVVCDGVGGIECSPSAAA